MHHKNANKKQKNVPTSGSNYARRMGIHSPPSGHPQNKGWATSAHKAGNECPKIATSFGQHRKEFIVYNL